MLTAVFVTSALGSTAQAAFSTTLAGDFSSTNIGTWTYGYQTTLGTGFTLFDEYGTGTGTGGNYEFWRVAGGNPYLGIYHDLSGMTNLINGTESLPAGGVVQHPGPAAEYSVSRFTASTAGVYSFSVLFTGQDVAQPATTDVHVYVNNMQDSSGLINGTTTSQSFNNTISLAAGGTIDFAVGYGSNGNYFFDSTGVSASVSVVTPEPASMTMMGIGLASLAGYGVRRRNRTQTTA
ncbi:PEP-CTERM sorting domain-containing protein [Limnoglobus roseus]|nr:PEP-CTERM sorting domain-containing protein [Limnoglobus roseus]